MKQFLSYAIGVAVALGIVFGLFWGRYYSSNAYARQVQEKEASTLTLPELDEILDDYDRGDRHIYATALAQSDAEVDDRVRLLAKTSCDDDKTIRSIAGLALQELGDKSLPKIKKMINSDDSLEVNWACSAVAALGPAADQFGDRVCQLLKEGNRHDQRSALFALEGLSPEVSAKALDDVIRQLDSPDFNVQCFACKALANMGPAATPAVKRLVQLVEEGNVSSRSRASMALASIGLLEGFDIIGTLAARLDSNNAIERARTLDALGSMGPDAKSAIEQITPMMYDKHLRVVPEAALAYYNITGDGEKSLGVLSDLLTDKTYRLTAAECIGGMGQEGEPAVPALVSMLGEPDENTVETALLALKGVGPAAASAVATIRPLLEHDDYLIAKAAKEAMDAIDANNK